MKPIFILWHTQYTRVLHFCQALLTLNIGITLQRHIVATDHQIDRLVYELYGLTEEEMGIVEGAT